MSIRSHYESLGVQNYYKSFGSEYKNPHAHLLTSILCQLLSDQTKFGSDLVTILDFACGSGEGIVALTNAFKTLGLNSNIILDISDPYTLPAFHQERLINPLPANVQLRNQFKWTFEELSHSDSMLSKYDIVISSFALHLAQSCLFSLLFNLSLHCRFLIVVSPHKKPHILPSTGWILVKKIQNRIHAWLYSSLHDL